MSESSTSPSPTSPSSPKGNTTQHILQLGDRPLHYTATAQWQTLFDREQPIAEMFYVAYLVQSAPSPDSASPPPSPGSAPRPLTFVFNGGPGAASAYLHVGALGPKRIDFDTNGKLPSPPVRLVDNPESWLSFTDLVFIDPIGTGFSRSLPPAQDKAQPPEKSAPSRGGSTSSSTPTASTSEPPSETEFWQLERDLKALGEFIQRFLSRHKRWLSPIFIAGESYGGFRVAKLAQKLQQEFGVGLSGAILISPALEFSLLDESDYALSTWATLIPSMAAAAAYHDRAQWAGEPGDLAAHQAAAEQFARKTLLPTLAMGDALSREERTVVYQQLADLIGLPLSLVDRQGGRVRIEVFARELLRDQQKIVGLYDASITAIDPFPDRVQYGGADPTLAGLDRLFTAGINSHLRDTLGVETDLTYHLLNFEVFNAWKFEFKGDFKQGFVGAVDELRVGMTLNPHMRVCISHGFFDLVTPYFASNYLVNLMNLNPEIRDNLTLKHYLGGHMFYTWEQSRQAWFVAMQEFYQTSRVVVF